MRKLTGISLLEMIVAIVIMAILAIAAFSYFHYCHRFIVDSQLRLKAVNLASETMELVYWDTTAVPDLRVPPDVMPPSTNARRLLPTFTPGTGNRYQTIDVRVTWDF